MPIANPLAARRGVFAAVLLIGLVASASLSADTVYLRNGSSIDGVVLGKHEGQVLIQIGNLGKMEIPEKDVLTIERNARTGPVNPERGEKKKDDSVKKLEKQKNDKKKSKPEDDEEDEIDPELEKEIETLVYDLTRQRSSVRTRAERKLSNIGKPAVSYVRPLTTHASELTRIASFRILKKYPQFDSAEAALVGLSDSQRFVRKLAWETLQEITGENWVYPWDDSAGDREREQAKTRWVQWWQDEKERREKEAAKKAAKD